MTKNKVSKSFIAFAGIVSLGVLAGCSSGTTYGTGVSQESQLASDVGGLLLLGSGKKKEKINYSSRPKLVKSPAGSSLPAPAEKIQGDSGYFPENPEEARARRIAAAPKADFRSGELPPGSNTYARDRGDGPKIERAGGVFKNEDHDDSAAEYRAASINGRKERLARLKEVRSLGGGVGPRKYLTQPPVEYRTPAETAEAGSIGEKVYSPNDKRKKGIFGGWKTRD